MALRMGHHLGIVGATTSAVLLLVRLDAVELPSLLALVGGLSLAVVIATDVIPVVLARSHPRNLAIWALRLLRIPYVLFYPVIKVVLGVRQAMLRLVGEDGSFGQRSKMAMMLESLVAGERQAAEERQLLLEKVAGFTDVVVREVMVPRTDMVTISRDMEIDEILVTLLECGHSRIPVHEESQDEIIGLFYSKDLIQLMASGREFQIDDFMRRPYFVPETKPIAELMQEFQQKRIHMAVVVDEFGGTSGLITLEDIIEECFGDIQDEYDVEPSQLVRVGENRVVADARIAVDEIEEYFGVELPERSDYDSLGGFLLTRTGSVPKQGDEIRWEHLLFRIMEADVKRIDSVEIEVIAPESEAA